MELATVRRSFGPFGYDVGEESGVKVVLPLTIRMHGSEGAVPPRLVVTTFAAAANENVVPEIVFAGPFKKRVCVPMVMKLGLMVGVAVGAGGEGLRRIVLVLPMTMYGSFPKGFPISPAKRDIGNPETVTTGPLGCSVCESIMKLP